MNNWKVILATMVIFGTGVVTGGLLVRNSERIRSPQAQRPAAFRPVQPLSAGGSRLDFIRRAQRELDLNAEQRQKADELLKQSQERSRKIMEPVAPLLREEVQKAREAFREILNSRQRLRFDSLMKQQPQRPRERDQRFPPQPGDRSAPAPPGS